MSGVATLKPRKRHFDEMNVDLPVPPQACSPARFVILPPPLKRGRCNPSSSPSGSSSPAFRITPSKPPASAASAPASPSAEPAPTLSAPRLSEDELAALARHVPRRLKKVVDKMAGGQVGTGEKVFTVADLRDIINSVLAEREAKLTDEFANILHDRLAEQFRDFSKFNEDYVTRQLRGRDFAYLS